MAQSSTAAPTACFQKDLCCAMTAALSNLLLVKRICHLCTGPAAIIYTPTFYSYFSLMPAQITKAVKIHLKIFGRKYGVDAEFFSKIREFVLIFFLFIFTHFCVRLCCLHVLLESRHQICKILPVCFKSHFHRAPFTARNSKQCSIAFFSNSRILK